MRSHVRALAGWRLEVVDKTRDIAHGDKHVEVEGVQMLSARWSLVWHGNHIERRKYLITMDPDDDNRKDWREGTWQLGVQWSPRLSVGAIYDYTTDSAEPRTHYFSGTADWRPHESTLIRVLAGASHGGLKCISNVCRYFPPFEGVKLTATVRY
jgi:hypothetical protein